jgi:phosphoenolpyruvate---glycerone phosphotransferase subunit DhaK
MKKFLNSPETYLLDGLNGFAAAHADLVQLHLEPLVLTRRERGQKVALISGGGSGHEPLHAGFIGSGMLDAACPGQVFTSPTPDQMIAAAELVDTGAGVLFIVKNYSGDKMNFEMAAEMLETPNATVIINDDVAVENSSFTTGRRGVAGTVIVEKMVGALAETGANLEQCRLLAEKVNSRIASMGVALQSCTVPAAGTPTFTLKDDEIEIGVGIHGEPGRRRAPMTNASSIVAELLDAILADLKPEANAQVLVLVNGLGATPLSELYLLFNETRCRLEQRQVTVARSLVGNYTTALEMAGASITVCVLDAELTALWDAPVHTAALRWGT